MPLYYDFSILFHKNIKESTDYFLKEIFIKIALDSRQNQIKKHFGRCKFFREL